MSTIKIRLKRRDGFTSVRTLIAHPMETGRRRELESGNLIPSHFIQTLTVKHNDQVVVSASLGPVIAKDPLFAFRFPGGEFGDRVTVSWFDNLGQQDSSETTIR